MRVGGALLRAGSLSFLVVLAAVAAVVIGFFLCVFAGPAAAQDEGTTPSSEEPAPEGGEEGWGDGVKDWAADQGEKLGIGDETDGMGTDENGQPEEDTPGSSSSCDLEAPSYGFEMLAPPTDVDRSYMICPPDNYFLEYVDFEAQDKILGVVPNPQSFNPFRGVRYAPDHAMNGLASTMFTINAKVILIAISTMNFAIDFNLIEALGAPIDEVIGRLGEGFYMKWLSVVLSASVLWASYLWLIRNKVSEAVTALVVASLVAAFGSWMIAGNGGKVAGWINEFTDVVSDSAFFAVAGLSPDSPEQQNYDGPGSENVAVRSANANTADGAQAEVSAEIWKRYVLDPWSRIQISESNPEVAEQHKEEILKLSNPDERREKLFELAEGNKDMEGTVNFVYPASHVGNTLLALFASACFVLLIVGMVVMLIISEFILFFLTLSFPIWGLFAVFPGTGIGRKLLRWYVGEAVQIFAYKLLISLVLLTVGLIFAATETLGTFGVVLLTCILTGVAFKYRKNLFYLLQPGGGLMNAGLERYEREKTIERETLKETNNTVERPNGATEGAVGRDSSGGLAEHYKRAADVGFLPDEVRQEGAAYAGAVPGRLLDAGRSGVRGGVGFVRGVQDAEGGSLLGAVRLDQLSKKRAEDPDSLTKKERDELHRAETLMEKGADPLSEVRKINREDRLRRRAEHRAGRERGYKTDEMLAGVRRPGESEADYVKRKREARQAAEEKRDELAASAAAGRTLTLVGQSRSCSSCGNPFSPSDHSQTVCPACRKDPAVAGRTGGGVPPGEQATARRNPVGGVAGDAPTVAAGRVAGGGPLAEAPFRLPPDSVYYPEDGRLVGSVRGGGPAPEPPPGYKVAEEREEDGAAGRVTNYQWVRNDDNAGNAENAENAAPSADAEDPRERLEEEETARRRRQSAEDREAVLDATHEGAAEGGVTGAERFAGLGPEAAALAGGAGVVGGGLVEGEREALERLRAERARRRGYEHELENLGGAGVPASPDDAGVLAGDAGYGAEGNAEEDFLGPDGAGQPREALRVPSPTGAINPDELPEGARLDPRSGVVTGYSPIGEDSPEPPPGYKLNVEGARSAPGWATEDLGDGHFNRYTWEPEPPPVAVPPGATFNPQTGVVSGEVAPGQRAPTPPAGYVGHTEAQAASAREGSAPGAWSWTPEAARGGPNLADGYGSPERPLDGPSGAAPRVGGGGRPGSEAWLDADPVDPPDAPVGDGAPGGGTGLYHGGIWGGERPEGPTVPSAPVEEGALPAADPTPAGDTAPRRAEPSHRVAWGAGAGWGAGGWSGMGAAPPEPRPEGASDAGTPAGRALIGRGRQVKNLADQGFSDAEIANAFGSTASEVGLFRSANGIPSGTDALRRPASGDAPPEPPAEPPNDRPAPAAGDEADFEGPPPSFWRPPDDVGSGSGERGSPPRGRE